VKAIERVNRYDEIDRLNRAERQDRPVHQHALRERPCLAHAPDHVEGGLDRHHRHHRRDEQHDHAERRQPFGLRRKLVQVFEDLAIELLRHQVIGKETLQRALKRSENRECGEQREGDGGKRHQCQHRGERQAAGHLRDTVFAAALRGEFCEPFDRVEIDPQTRQQRQQIVLLPLHESLRHAPMPICVA
jgi:hypothetical protein